MKTNHLFHHLIKPLLLLTIATVLTACGSGEKTVTLPTDLNSGEDAVRTSGETYDGPTATDADILKFQRTLWSYVIDNGPTGAKCSNCHSDVNGQTEPMFARTDDIHLAYAAVLDLVDREDPAASPMVLKVAGGHNCDGSVAACARALEEAIEDWFATEESGSAEVIELSPLSAVFDPGSTKTLPSELPEDEAEKQATIFAQCIYPLLTNGDTSSCSVASVASHQSIPGTNYCGNCHRPNGIEGSQSPFFASEDIDAAYSAVKSKINIEVPSASNIVVRLRNEFHNCFSDCEEDASLFEAAIAELADNIDTQEVEPGTVFSKRQILEESTPANSGGRFEEHAIALYTFEEGSGNEALDTGIDDVKTNLILSDNVTWVGGYGIRLQGPQAYAAAAPGTTEGLIDALKLSGELSIETWVVPGNVSQEGPARIVTISNGEEERDLMLGQTLYNYDFSLRQTVSDLNGEPMLSTPDADEVLQATLQHVVATFHPLEGRKIYVNGELIISDADEGFDIGSFNNWDSGFRLFLGEEVGHRYSWDGIIRMLAFHNKALTQEQILANYDAGVGQKYYMMFYVSHLINDVDESSPSYIDDAYIVFEASEFDDFSYLFSNPFFVVLGNAPATIPEIPMEGMRIGINGKEATVGQAFNQQSVTLGGDDYQAAGQPLLKIGTILAKEKGAAEDQFYLTFKRIGTEVDARTTTETFAPSDPVGDDEATLPSYGIKTFEEIDASMSAMTGVPRSRVQNTFELVKQQLPSSPQMNGFLSAHQVGIAQMAIAYCNTLVSDSSLRSSYFPGFNFDQSVNSAFTDPADLDLILNPLMNRMMSVDQNNELSDMPPKADDVDGDGVRTMLTNLVRDLEVCDANEQAPNPDTGEAECAPPSSSAAERERTATVVKATCAALLGSAVTLVQ